MSVDSEELRGRNAQELLNNQTLRDALRVFKEEIFEVWLNTKMHDTADRDAIWRQYKAAQHFEGILVGFIETGKIARQELERKLKEI